MARISGKKAKQEGRQAERAASKREQTALSRREEAPAKMPRPDVDLPEKDASVKTVLAHYLENAGISINAFIRATGLDDKTVHDLVKGRSIPSLPTAWIVDQVSKGAVPMECWLGLPKAKAALSIIYNKMPEEVREQMGDEP